MAKKDFPNPGVADPGNLRDHLAAIDAATLQLMAVRTRIMKEVQDSFTGLRSSAQILREIFFGVELPIRSVEELIERAGGPHRLIEVSYKETGNQLYALADVIAAIPDLKKCLPITSFEKLADQLEEIREEGPDTGPTWFVEDISNEHLDAAIERENSAIVAGKKIQSVFTRPRQRVDASCCCGGEAQSPAELVANALARLSSNPSGARWTGKPISKARDDQSSERHTEKARRD